MFFFGSFEGYNREYSTPQFFTVPDAKLRSGDFSGATNNGGTLQTIYNPFTGDPNGANRAAFENNRIPAGMINSIALKIQELYPLPNTGGTGLGDARGGRPRGGRTRGGRRVNSPSVTGKAQFDMGLLSRSAQ